MTKCITQLCCQFAAFLSLLACTTQANAQWNPGRHMSKSMAITLARGKAIEQKSDYGFCQTCYLGAFLQPGNDSFMTMPLEAGRSYVFMGSTACDDCDLDILVVDENGRVVAKDTDSDHVPAVEFTPSSTARYTVRLKLYRATTAQFCGMTLMQKGGWAVPIENLALASARTLKHCQYVASKTPARFLQEPGEWAMIGSIMREGEKSGYSDMRLGTGRRVIVACGDKHTRDLDLHGHQESPNRELANDTESDPTPILAFKTIGSARYAVNITNAHSSGATLVMTAILDID